MSRELVFSIVALMTAIVIISMFIIDVAVFFVEQPKHVFTYVTTFLPLPQCWIFDSLLGIVAICCMCVSVTVLCSKNSDLAYAVIVITSIITVALVCGHAPRYWTFNYNGLGGELINKLKAAYGEKIVSQVINELTFEDLKHCVTRTIGLILLKLHVLDPQCTFEVLQAKTEYLTTVLLKHTTAK